MSWERRRGGCSTSGTAGRGSGGRRQTCYLRSRTPSRHLGKPQRWRPTFGPRPQQEAGAGVIWGPRTAGSRENVPQNDSREVTAGGTDRTAVRPRCAASSCATARTGTAAILGSCRPGQQLRGHPAHRRQLLPDIVSKNHYRRYRASNRSLASHPRSRLALSGRYLSWGRRAQMKNSSYVDGISGARNPYRNASPVSSQEVV